MGFERETFVEMVKTLKAWEKKKVKHPGKHRPPKFAVEDQVLMTLMYWREYRTMFHIGTDYGISESTVSRTINKTEDILKKSKRFDLPGKKSMTRSPMKYQVWVVDTTETPIERPKKNNGNIIQGRTKSIHSKHK